MWWAAAGATELPSWLTLTNVLALFGALSPILLVVIGKRLTSKVDESTSRKTDAEARKTDADAARELIAEARRIMADKEALADAKIERVKAEAANDIEKVRMLAERETSAANTRLSRLELDMARLQHALNVHLPWDVEAWARIKIMDPNFPEPPAIEQRLVEDERPWPPV
jgi:hypothetical protein